MTPLTTLFLLSIGAGLPAAPSPTPTPTPREEWFVELLAGATLRCNGAVVPLNAQAFRIVTATHCFGGYDTIVIGSRRPLRLQSARGTTVPNSDFGFFDLPCSFLGDQCPAAATVSSAGGTPDAVPCREVGKPFKVLKAEDPDALARGSFATLCRSDDCNKCRGRVKTEENIVDTNSGAPVVSATKNLIGLISTESYASVASYCPTSNLPVLPDCSLTDADCRGRLSGLGFQDAVDVLKSSNYRDWKSRQDKARQSLIRLDQRTKDEKRTHRK